MIKTFGLTHLALGVRDVNAAFEFYSSIFGMVAVYRGDGFVQAQTPGARDVLVFEQSTESHDSTGGVKHFGFRLSDAADIGRARAHVEKAGGMIIETGEFCPGEPYLFARDLDGYVFEIWYELPTPVDPE